MKDLKSAILLILAFTVICGGLYPAVVTGVVHILFPMQARGSFITDGSGKDIGSTLIGQPFSDSRYLWPRPSATTDFAYNPMGSGGSNSGPTNPDYIKIVADRVKELRDTGIAGPIPADMAQASASGLDPHISPVAASIQVPRIAQARRISEDSVRKIIKSHTEDHQIGFLGERRVNVLAVNLELDTLKP